MMKYEKYEVLESGLLVKQLISRRIILFSTVFSTVCINFIVDSTPFLASDVKSHTNDVFFPFFFFGWNPYF